MAGIHQIKTLACTLTILIKVFMAVPLGFQVKPDSAMVSAIQSSSLNSGKLLHTKESSAGKLIAWAQLSH